MRPRWKRTYAGYMTSYLGRPIPQASQLRCQGLELSRDGQRRLKWFEFYRTHGNNARLTCRHFGISPQTFYRWKRRYASQAMVSLEARSSRPHRVRQPTWDARLEQAVLRLRRTYPRWGKAKLQRLLQREGTSCSISMVGRILGKLKRTGQLVEPRTRRTAKKHTSRPRPWAMRKPRDYEVREPGDLVQVDTKDVRPIAGVLLKHFSGRDVFSRWDVIELHHRATAASAALFLDALEARCPFPVRAIQVDGGSEFKAGFEQACRRRRIRLFVLPPKSPKLNAHVERANRTHQEEFYEVHDLPWNVTDFHDLLLEWEHVYNTVRPHQSLGYLTPQEYLTRWRAGGAAPGAQRDQRAARARPASPPNNHSPTRHRATSLDQRSPHRRKEKVSPRY